jgi:hypothetical protein
MSQQAEDSEAEGGSVYFMAATAKIFVESWTVYFSYLVKWIIKVCVA